jgi:hypothetical protein
VLFPIFLPRLRVQVLTGQTRPSLCHPSIPRHLIEDEDDDEHENENKAPLQRDVSFDSGPGVETPGRVLAPSEQKPGIQPPTAA